MPAGYKQSQHFCSTCQRPTLHAIDKTIHGFRCLLTLVTCGLFLPLWLLVNRNETRCQICGTPLAARQSRGSRGSPVFLANMCLGLLALALIGMIAMVLSPTDTSRHTFARPSAEEVRENAWRLIVQRQSGYHGGSDIPGFYIPKDYTAITKQRDDPPMTVTYKGSDTVEVRGCYWTYESGPIADKCPPEQTKYNFTAIIRRKPDSLRRNWELESLDTEHVTTTPRKRHLQ